MTVEIVENNLSIPKGVDLELNDKRVKVTGEKGEIKRDFSHTKLQLEHTDNSLRIWAENPRKREASQVNTITSHIKNMIKGVTEGHIYKMKIVFIHFPITVRPQGDIIYIENFCGETKSRTARILPGVDIRVDEDDVILEGVDIEAVGQTAANIQQACKIRNKDLRKFLDGIYVYSKE